MPQLIITDTPAKEVGEHINTIIHEHSGDVVCLLSGGSALAIIEHIHPGKECAHQSCHDEQSRSEKVLCARSECRTIFMMGDERVSREQKTNNYLQLKNLYPNHPVLANTLDTTPLENETAKDFAYRIEKTFSDVLVKLSNPKIVAVLGMGTDGHIAGIFPMDEKAFRQTYQDDVTYAPVDPQGLIIDSRASITPTWLLTYADIVLGFVCGSSKKNILIDLNTNDKKLFERPAELLKLHRRAIVYTDQDITPTEARGEAT